MKPDWDKLMEDFEGSPTALVADVDCTTAGRRGGYDLCKQHAVRGYPTIKYGDPSDLKSYKGGRTYDELRRFADENLRPTCGPANLDLCSADLRAKVEGFMNSTLDRLEGKVKNALKVMAEEVPLMKKVLVSKRASKGEL